MTRLPRVFIVRHGETEWSISGQHTGKTDIPLTPKGEEAINRLAPQIVGPGKLLDLQHLKHIFVSPRLRARRTFELLFTSPSSSSSSLLPPFVTEPNVQEWDYGAYEGLRTNEIVAMRGTTSFDIWTQGCQGGESTEEMTQRVDCMIEKIVKIQKEHFDTQGKEEEEDFGDVLIVSHGHFSRCFMTRWCKLDLTHGRIFVTDPGSLSIAGYQHGSFDERSLLGVNLFGAV